jgi:glycosyltransferase involved in cell wall biosynthesis
LVPEKRHLDLIRAFRKAALSGWKLAIIGSADHNSSYADDIAESVKGQADIVAPGFLGGIELAEVYSQAGIFVLPSSHEGLPIALLEALSYGVPCIASDIPANLCVGMESSRYFPCGDANALASLLRREAQKHWGNDDRDAQRSWVVQTFNWEQIAKQTAKVYGLALGKRIDELDQAVAADVIDRAGDR